jgi:16S rRNA C967 or C1407 C5-methylase (RsmB/RsmF family)/NOL1/NOP2/fmu family ribosome biogenesis protein
MPLFHLFFVTFAQIFATFAVNGFNFLKMFPEEFVKRIHAQKYIDAEALLKALSGPSPVSVRINSAKWGKKPVDSQRIPWSENGYYLRNRPSYTLDPLFHSGCYYPQEASGMFLEQMIKQTSRVDDNMKVLDLCAAPGGKSTLLSEIIGPGNLLVSNDAIRSRSAVLAETLSKWGSGNFLVTQNDPTAFARLPGYFDVIFVDAPCSGEGMFRSDVALKEWSVNNTRHCAERQKRIIMDVWPALKENGILIYSTCTFNPGENEENIKWLIGKNEASSLNIDLSEFNGITEIDFEGIFGYGFYPGQVRGEGFFIAAVRKTSNQEKLKIKSQKRSDLLLTSNDIRIANDWANFSKERLFRWGDEVFEVPCAMDEYLNLYRNLKIVKAGTKIFTVKNTSYLPSHEVALSAGLKKEAFPCVDLDLSSALKYMKRDTLIIKNAIKGWNVVTYKGVNIGFINNLGNRINNYFPVEWRIRMDLPESGEENLIEWES